MLWHILKYRNHIDFVLIDTYSTTSFWYAYSSGLLCRGLQLPYIPILHGGNLEYRLKHTPRLSRQLFGRAQVCVAPSAFMEHIFKQYGYENLVLIPNSFELKQYRFLKRSFIQPRLLWVRSLAQIYNPNMAIEVLKQVQEKYPIATLTMVGPPKEVAIEQVQTRARELEVEVTVTGQLSKQQWIELSESHDIFINTTNIDNTPVSVMEAMALGLPVVSTNVGGVPYLIEHGQDGLLVPPKDPKKMAQAVFQLLDDSSLVNLLTQNARMKVESFDWEIVKKQWIKLLT
jgi:L-malate glycosyltransferase